MTLVPLPSALMVPMPDTFWHPSDLHGQAHVTRVMVHAARLVAATGQWEHSARLWAAVFRHDIARRPDGICYRHGADAAQRLRDEPPLQHRLAAIRLSVTDYPAIEAAVTAHSALRKCPEGSAEIRDLDPMLDAMRAVKSPREVAVIREATRIAGLAMMEAMRDARPGMFEYELQAAAEFVFTRNGAVGPAYFALIATAGNTYYSHYHKNTERLAVGDLIQFDYAPDYKYYQSDVTRVFPANGKFTPRQREFYTIYLRFYQAIMTSIRVHATPADVMRDAVAKMDRIMAGFTFTDPKIKTAAELFVTAQRGRYDARGLGHNVGLEVHDVGGLQAPTLEPGRIFTIEPAMQIEDEHLGLRLEDMLHITETGYENLSAFVPIEIADIERLMAEPGLSDARRKPPH